MIWRTQRLLAPVKLLQNFIADASVLAPVSKFQNEWSCAQPYESIPSMTKLQTIRSFLPGGKYYKLGLTDMHTAMRSEYGEITKLPAMLGRPDTVIVYGVDDIEEILKLEGQWPVRPGLQGLTHFREKIRPEIYDKFGNLASGQGEKWFKFRSTVNPVMMKPKTIKLYVDQIDAIAKDFLKLVAPKRDSENEMPANFSSFVNLWSLESITYIAINRRLGLLRDDVQDENAKKLIQLVREFFTLSCEIELIPPIWKYIEIKSFRRLMRVQGEVTGIVMQYIDKAIEDLKSQPQIGDREESILEKLLKVDKKVAVVMTADAMFAGVDTTAAGFLGVLYCLAKNPEKQEKLREELRGILPNKSDSLTPEKMLNMPYLRAVIKEGLRVYPPVSGTARTTGDDLVLSGFQIPRGTNIILNMTTPYMQEKYFGQALNFIPERWLKIKTAAECPHVKDSNPFAFLPFGFGPRMCIGKRIAELEMEVLLIRIIREYQVEWHHADMKVKSVLVNIPDGDLKFRFTEVKF